ncbi:MAG: acetyl-CoA carboxylase biotin carboxyl carrier protein [Actinobacteria bacterium]|jgi:oxaloacetate decarboxylase alpha subunit|nr:acetyl-CoA carboxylase biotin carboxyl carrier protein [Actinomycetota bacterium]MCL6093341.1 acetyl-CoA carboxylase biotin carboxyl carrier protein [Actinomycetota bacterium]
MVKARRVLITDTTLRDGHQSLWATRMRTGDMLPILGRMDEIGFYSLEAWGGATFDSCLRFLNENPWERLRTIKQHCPKTPLQMLLRGQNLVGYRHYGDEIVRKFVLHAAENGVDIFRVFDALNDTRNIEVAAEAIKEAGKHFQAAVSYTISPVHTLDHYLETAHRFAEMGADSICIKDMAALLSPFHCEQLVRRLKEEIDLTVEVHCHYIGGLAPMTYLKAIEAGADIIDTATVPLAFGASNPATEMVVTALTGTPYDTELELDRLFEIAKYFEGVRQRGGFSRGVTSITHMQVYSHQVPGGMISNLESQLEEQNALDRLPEVLKEIPLVRAEVGYPPLVTPMSQIVGTQAVLNVLSGKRWQVVPDEMKSYLRGKYGQAPGPVNAEVMHKVLGDEQPITCRPAELIDETLDRFAEEIGDLARNEEDVLTYALFPATARVFLERRRHGVEDDVFLTQEQEADQTGGAAMDINHIRELIAAVEESSIAEVTIEEGDTRITVRKGGEAAPGEAVAAPAMAAKPAVPDSYFVVKSPMVGTFYRAASPTSDPFVEEGDEVAVGQTLCILEAMKLMNEVTSEVDGTVRSVLVEDARPVEYGTPMFYIEPLAANLFEDAEVEG